MRKLYFSPAHDCRTSSGLGAAAAAKLAGVGGDLAAAPAVAAAETGRAHARSSGHAVAGHGFQAGRTVDHAANGFDPSEILRDFDMGKTRRLPSGRLLREWEVVAEDKEIEVAPGMKFAAWTYNGRVCPTLRAREGERLRIKFINGSEHPHTIHFHGIHPAGMDGIDEAFGGG